MLECELDVLKLSIRRTIKFVYACTLAQRKHKNAFKYIKNRKSSPGAGAAAAASDARRNKTDVEDPTSDFQRAIAAPAKLFDKFLDGVPPARGNGFSKRSSFGSGGDTPRGGYRGGRGRGGRGGAKGSSRGAGAGAGAGEPEADDARSVASHVESEGKRDEDLEEEDEECSGSDEDE